jgi:hypothetical protein
MVVDEQTLLDTEKSIISHHRKRLPGAPWSGLALSGGGIRSATFCIGALQALAAADLIKRFDYLSSVSGGGYTATALQWWRHKGGATGSDFRSLPYGAGLHETGESKPLTFLRWHSKYLMPGNGITIWSGVAAVLRTVFLNLLVWIPLLAFTLWLIIWLGKLVDVRSLTDHIILQDKSPLTNHLPEQFLKYPVFGLMIVIAIFLVAAFLVFAVIIALFSAISIPGAKSTIVSRLVRAAKRSMAVGFVLTIPSWMLILELGNIGYVELADYVFPDLFLVIGLGAFIVSLFQIAGWDLSGLNYRARRWFDEYGGIAVAGALALGLAGLLPFLQHIMSTGALKLASGVLTFSSGMAAAAYGHRMQVQQSASNSYAEWGATFAAFLFLVFIAASAFQLATLLDDVITGTATQRMLSYSVVASIIFAAILGLLTNVNYMGLHRFYRDRLMEAFMPSEAALKRVESGYSDADRIQMSELWPQNICDTATVKWVEWPYPIINTNAILVNDSNTRIRSRGGESFVLTPLFVGSNATGWERTVEHIEKHGPLTLASAMAASGAAANSNAGYVGTGATRNKFISIVMMLLNVRLGLWVGAPRARRRGVPNHFRPGLTYGVLGLGYKSTSNFVELSDGGHFDNLGVYELVRRRVRTIIVIDSEADPSTKLSALVSVAQRVRADFGVDIQVGTAAGQMSPQIELSYPAGARCVAASYFVVPIVYPDGPPGALIYVKSNMIGDLSFVTKGYKAENADFPHDSTLNQFFSPAQFEAYRELGYRIVESLIGPLQLKETIGDPEAILRAFGSGP